jgi:acyl-CoA dehydrogenase
MIPRTIFQPEHEQFRDSVRRFLQAEAAPHYQQWEKDGQVDPAIWRKAGEQGYLCPQVPEEYGGFGADFLYNVVVTEEISNNDLPGLVFMLHSDIVAPYILEHGTEQQKLRYLPRCVTGELITGLALTEPGAGSDVQAIKTSAVPDGEAYLVNGSKTFISNGQVGQLFIVAAKTAPDAGAKGISLFIVEGDTPGFQRGRKLEKIGLKAQDTSELFFQDMRVPRENLLGGVEGAGFAQLVKGLAQERLVAAVSSLAGATTTLNHTLEYVKERKAFGQALACFQNTRFKLAELDSELTAMRVFVDRCLELHLEGELDEALAAKAKLLVTQLNGRVADECLQLHGGYGYMWEYPVARAYADARVQRIFGGSSEIMKLIISRNLLRDR